jgi:hypothetical protein
MRKLIATLLICLFTLPALPQQADGAKRSRPDGQSAARLPVRKVVLYKNGIGYFEHAGRVRGNQEMTIDFTTSQLNDVLQSLTVLDLGNGRINGISYNSTAPLEQRLRALRLPLDQKPTQAQFLDAIRGARIEVRNNDVRGGGAAASGRLLSVEEHERKLKDDSSVSDTYVSLMTDGGEIKSFALTPATSVRILDRDLQEDAARFLQLLSTTRKEDTRRMTISTTGAGERPLFVSYVSEVPVWKSTYRIVLPDGDSKQKKPMIQGWAVVDNTVGEDWDNVQLSLVAGAPQSFIQQLSQPYYTRRPVVQLPASVMLSPQTFEATVRGGADDGALDKMAMLVPGVNAPPSPVPMPPKSAADSVTVTAQAQVTNGFSNTNGSIGGLRGRNSGSGGGVGSGSGGSVGAGSGGGMGGGNYQDWLDRKTQALSAEQRAAFTALANAQDLGDLYEYKLDEPITIHKNQSALVPILQHEIDAEEVSIWNDNVGRALRGLWITNTSGLTLDAGSFNVLEEGAFAGEGLLDPLKAGEKRLVSYAVDLGLHVESKSRSDRQRISSVRLAHGVLTQTSEVREKRTYVIRNEDTKPRTIIIEHPVRPGWKLAKAKDGEDDLKPAETSASFYRFRVTVDAKKTVEVPVSEYEPLARTYALSNLQSRDIDLLVQQKEINPELEAVLRRVVGQKGEIAQMEMQIKSQQEQMAGINDDQQRVRENLKALKGSAEEKQLVQRYTRELNDQEDHVQSLRKSISELQARRSAAEQAFDRMLQDLTFEAAM